MPELDPTNGPTNGPPGTDGGSAPQSSAGPKPSVAVAAPPRIGLSLLGRDAELAQLDAIFARAVDYRAPQLVTVVGTQGVGKTRLVAEWLARLLGRAPAGTPSRPRVYRGRATVG